ncbi:hypothetical protein FOZ63_005331, partial [Perkinsus olseni]
MRHRVSAKDDEDAEEAKLEAGDERGSSARRRLHERDGEKEDASCPALLCSCPIAASLSRVAASNGPSSVPSTTASSAGLWWDTCWFKPIMPVPNVASKICMLVVVLLTLPLSGQFLPCEGPLLIDSFPECDPRLDDYFATCNVARTTAALAERDDDLPAVAVDCKFGATGNSAVHSIVAAYQIFTNSPEGLRRCTELLHLFLRSGANPNIRRSRDCRAPSHDAVFLTSRSSSPTGLHWAAQTLRDWGAQADTMEDLSGYTPLELSLDLLGRDHRLTFALAGCTNISFPSRPDLSSESSLVQMLCQPCPPGTAGTGGRCRPCVLDGEAANS